MGGNNAKYILIIGLILTAAFLSQNLDILGKGKTFSFVKGISDTAQDFAASGSDWARDNVLSKLSGEVEKRGEMVIEGVETEKEKISESILEKTKNYFSGIADAVLQPGKKEIIKESCDCPATQTPAPIYLK